MDSWKAAGVAICAANRFLIRAQKAESQLTDAHYGTVVHFIKMCSVPFCEFDLISCRMPRLFRVQQKSVQLLILVQVNLKPLLMTGLAPGASE